MKDELSKQNIKHSINKDIIIDKKSKITNSPQKPTNIHCEDIVFEKEYINSEINESDENDYNYLKNDVKDCNENDFLYNILQKKKTIRFDDDTIPRKEKNNVKSTIIRFILTNVESSKNRIKVRISPNNSMPEIVKLNTFIPENISDKVDGRDYVNYHIVQRIRSDLPMLKQDHVGTNIDCDRYE